MPCTINIEVYKSWPQPEGWEDYAWTAEYVDDDGDTIYAYGPTWQSAHDRLLDRFLGHA